MLERLRRISISRIESQCTIFTRSQSTGRFSKSAFHAEPQSLRSDTWNLFGSQENVFVSPRSMFESSQTPHQGILHSTNQSATGAAQNYMADQRRLQISEVHSAKFPTLSTFSCWKIRFKTQVSSCSGFLSKAMLWIKEVVMVDSVDDLKSSRSIQGYHFRNF